MDVTRRIQRIAQDRLPEMTSFLRGLAETSSETYDRLGVNQAGDFLAQAIPNCLQHEILEHEQYGNCHFFHSSNGSFPIALMGHLDNVIPEGFDRVEQVGEHLVGPGVQDMKGGLVVMLYALRILDEIGCLDKISVRCLVNSDEEVNSPWSRSLIPKMRGCRAGFVFEVAGLRNEVVIQRIGITVFRITTYGVPSHAGTGRLPKSSAIMEMATRIQQIEALNSSNLIVNVGMVRGGKAYNFVPDKVEAVVAIRYWNKEDEAQFFEHINDLLAVPQVKGCSAECEIITGRPPLIPTDESCELFEMCSTVAKDMGQPLTTESRAGGSDASFLQALGIPTLDGWGPRGDYDFSPDEYIVIQSLAERSALVAACIYRLCHL